MPMTIYKLFGSTEGDSIANLDIQLDGVIQAIHMSMSCKGVNLIDEGAEAELSFLSSNSFQVSDVRGSLMIVQSISGLLTSGALNSAVNAQISSLEIPVNAGERVHLHINHVGTPSSVLIHAYMYVSDKGLLRASGRRR